MTKSYDPPLAGGVHSPLYRVDKAIKVAQQRLDVAIDAKRHHTNQNLAQLVIKEAREALKKSEKLRVLKIMELAALAKNE
jgi:CubicO group peptidase (beta-lactamase class C family)